MCIVLVNNKTQKHSGDLKDLYQILNSMRVIEGSSFVAAPSAGLYLAQMGAEVIRFDQIGGGPDFKRWPLSNAGHSFYWEGLNKGKKSIAVDLGLPEGRELIQALVCAPGDEGGILLTNFPARGFLAHESLRAQREDLITIRVMGRADGRSALDYNVNAAVGLPLMTGPDTLDPDVPVNQVLPAWDLMTGIYASFALLAADRTRRLTSEGGEIRVPLMDMATSTLANLGMVGEVLHEGVDRPRYGNNVYGFLGRDYITKDHKRLIIMALTPGHWTGLVKALDIREAVDRVERETGVSFDHDEGLRFIHREALNEVIQAAVSQRQSTELYSTLEAHKVCWGPYNKFSDVVKDAQMIAENPVYSDITHKSGLTYPTPGSAATLPEGERLPPVRAPFLGEHTDEVLMDVLKLSSGEVGKLHDNKIVADKLAASTET